MVQMSHAKPTLPRPYAVAAAWLAGLAMLATATSLVGVFVAPVAIPAAGWVVARRGTPWSVRVPLVVGMLALALLFGLWLADGATTGTTTPIVEG